MSESRNRTTSDEETAHVALFLSRAWSCSVARRRQRRQRCFAPPSTVWNLIQKRNEFSMKKKKRAREAESRSAVLDARLRRSDAGSAHVVEHQTLIPKVAGSSPNKSLTLTKDQPTSKCFSKTGSEKKLFA